MAHSMLRALVDRGHEVEVLESRPPLNDSYRHDGYVIDGVRVIPHVDKDQMPEVMATADVIVTHLENTARAAILSRWMQKPCFVINHNDFDNTRSWSGEYDLIQIYNSEWLKAELQEISDEVILGLGYPTLVIRPPIFSGEYATKPGDKVTLINLNEDKGAKVFYALAERCPDIEFMGVVGAHGDQLIRDLPNVEIVRHTNPHDMKEAVYGRTRVLLMPSIYESWGRCAVEALASGIPVIANPTSGLTESLGEAGIFCDRDHIDSWETALRGLMDGRKYRAASRRALKRSNELDALREQDLAAWVAAVEDYGGYVSRSAGNYN